MLMATEWDYRLQGHVQLLSALNERESCRISVVVQGIIPDGICFVAPVGQVGTGRRQDVVQTHSGHGARDGLGDCLRSNKVPSQIYKSNTRPKVEIGFPLGKVFGRRARIATPAAEAGCHHQARGWSRSSQRMGWAKTSLSNQSS